MKIRCLKCNDIIESLSAHGLKECSCGSCFINGGDKYIRIGGEFKDIAFVYEDGTKN